MKEGSNTKEGYLYHDVEGVDLPAQRTGSKRRADFICDVVSVENRRVLDIGCNAGGISLQVARRGANVVGVDYDYSALKIGMVEALKQGLDARFFEQNIDLEYFYQLRNLDIVLWLSEFQWFAKQYGFDTALEALYIISRKCRILVFESSAADGRAGIPGTTQDDVYAWLIKNTCFTQIDRYPPVDDWNKRDIFVCSSPVVSWRRHRHVALHRFDRKTIQKTNEEGELGGLLKNGAKIMRTLKGETHAPEYFQTHETSLYMSYCGIPAITVPEKLTEEEVVGILDMLRRHQVVHRDITPHNLMFDGKHIVLIDYGWATYKGKGLEPPETLGEGYRDPNGFNDEFSLRKIHGEFKFRSQIGAH
jgi:SAM-dependent methyltransferase